MRKLIGGALIGAIMFGAISAATISGVEAGRGGNGKGNNNTVAAASIVLDQDAASLGMGSAVTFTTVAGDLKGGEYPMVYLECWQGSDVVYGQLDHPDVTFVLGGGSSPWMSSPGPATCMAHLMAYGGKAQGYDTIRELAATSFFDVQ